MRTLVEYGLANAAAATAFALLALAIGVLFRRPAVRNALWVIVFVRLLLPPVWNIDLPFPAAPANADPETAVAESSIPEPRPEPISLPIEPSIADDELNA